MDSEVFLDTSFAIALSAPSDRLHDRALHLAKILQASETPLRQAYYLFMRLGSCKFAYLI